MDATVGTMLFIIQLRYY